MRQRRIFVTMFVALALSATPAANAAAPFSHASLAVMSVKPVKISAMHLTVLRAALLRPEALTLRANILAISRQQSDVSKRIDFARIDRSRVPVLVLPAQPQSLRVITRADHYTAITQLGNAIVTIDGTRTAVTLPAGSRLPPASSRIILRTM